MRQVKDDSLEMFATRIMTRLKAGGATDSLERIICRHITGKNEKVSAFMSDKVVTWRFGKAKETVKFEGHIEHTVFDASKLTDEQLAEAERLVESASTASDKG